MGTREQFLGNLDRLTSSVAVLRDVVQGPATGDTSLVLTSSGSLRTLARALAEIDAQYVIETRVLHAEIAGITAATIGAATHAEVDARIQTVVGAAPAALDTLQELSMALGNDANFAGSVTTQLASKAALMHTHSAANVASGTLDIARLPVATSGTSSSTQVTRADDILLSNACTPTTYRR
ncbi:MAG: major tail fiber protein [Rhodospirillaceae bacterium]|nr:MAG: major tail fiber protein [Rhodospirillaceae bacterium]